MTDTNIGKMLKELNEMYTVLKKDHESKNDILNIDIYF